MNDCCPSKKKSMSDYYYQNDKTSFKMKKKVQPFIRYHVIFLFVSHITYAFMCIIWLSLKCWLHFHKSAQTLFCVLRIFCNRENFFQYTNYQNNKNLVGKKNGFNWIFFSLYVHKCLWNNWIMTLFVFHFWKI